MDDTASPDPGAPTFFHADAGPDPVGWRVRLEDEEARHVRSLRVREGEEVRLTDGRGRLWRARMEETGSAAVVVPQERIPAPPPLPVEVVFGVGNKNRTLWLVEKSVELGAASLQPVEFRRSRSVADAGRSTGFWRKAGRRAVSALKQCGGARLPDIGPVRDLHEVLDRSGRPSPDGVRVPDGPDLLLDRRGGRSLRAGLEGWRGDPPVRILLGPEGGLSRGERETCLEAGCVPATLGPRVLRFETAAVAALAVAGQMLDDGRSIDGEEDAHG